MNQYETERLKPVTILAPKAVWKLFPDRDDSTTTTAPTATTTSDAMEFESTTTNKNDDEVNNNNVVKMVLANDNLGQCWHRQQGLRTVLSVRRRWWKAYWRYISAN